MRALWEHWQRCNAKELLPIHIKTIEERYGQSPRIIGDIPAAKIDREVQRMRYMQRHAMCAEALRALQLAVTPMAKRNGTIPGDIEMRLQQGISELTLLLDKPHLFYDHTVFTAIDHARSVTVGLLDLVRRSGSKARSYARSKTLPHINTGLEATFKGG